MLDPAACFSRRLGTMEHRVADLVQGYTRMWWETAADPLPPNRIYPASEKRSIERELSAMIDRVLTERKSSPPDDPARESIWMERLAAGLRTALKRILGRVELPIDSVYDTRFVESTRRFLRAAREFDPGIGIDSVFQALRNVWIMNTLQVYLGIEVEHTDAVFGYSMIYPYLDNLLDDETIPSERKLEQTLRLKGWLEGDGGPAATPRGERLRALVKMIERRFSRKEYPGVFQSMLTIFNAQIRSLLQQRGISQPYTADILGISFEKGGTSVLADGYLVAGNLTPEQEDFCFGFGIFLQLADDLQDIAEDMRRGHMTLFSQTAKHWPLDGLVHKLIRFTSAVLDSRLDTTRPRHRALSELIRRSCTLMHMESAGKNSDCFSRVCLRTFQKAFPVRFSYLKRQRRILQENFLTGHEKIGDLDPVSAAFLTVSSRAFALD